MKRLIQLFSLFFGIAPIFSQSIKDTDLVLNVFEKDVDEKIAFVWEEHAIQVMGGDIFPIASAYDPISDKAVFISYKDGWKRTGMMSDRVTGRFYIQYYKLDRKTKNLKVLRGIDIVAMNTKAPFDIQFETIDSICIKQMIACTAGFATSHSSIKVDFENKKVITHLDSLVDIKYDRYFHLMQASNGHDMDSIKLIQTRGIQNAEADLDVHDTGLDMFKCGASKFCLRVRNEFPYPYINRFSQFVYENKYYDKPITGIQIKPDDK